MKLIDKFLILSTIVFIYLAIGTIPVCAQQSIDGTIDISQLMKEAETVFDLTAEDAIILFDSERIRLNQDGMYEKFIHRIIWINSENAIKNYGDVRVPYDASSCSLLVTTVRTWHDNQWWETDPAKIVETVPKELVNAAEYDNIRETTLHHEGIELPCILEVKYSIKDKEPFRRGWDGNWTFVRNEPVIKSWFGFELPSGWWPHIYEFPGAPAPIKTTDENLELDMYSWQRGPYQAKTFPTPDNIENNESFLLWSTWRDWGSLGAHFRTHFDESAVGNQYLLDQLDSLLEGAYTNLEKARRIAAYVKEKTSFIDYDWKYWLFDMRPALKTYSSSYGHTLDRTILAATLFSKSGISTLPALLSPCFGDIKLNVPGLSQLDILGLWLSGENLAAYYDPIESKIKSGPKSFYNRMAWLAGNDSIPYIRVSGKDKKGNDKPSINDIRLELSYDKENNRFTGNGFFAATNYFNQFLEMSGMRNEASDYLQNLIFSIFRNAKLTGYNPSELSLLQSVLGFQFEIDLPTIEKDDRIELNLGESTCGILANLPDKIELFHNVRTSPMRFPCLMSQNIEVTINMEGLELISSPEDNKIENEAGTFSIRSRESDKYGKKLIVGRSLVLNKADYSAEEWLPLRTLLLADRNENNRLILLKKD